MNHPQITPFKPIEFDGFKIQAELNQIAIHQMTLLTDDERMKLPGGTG